MAAMEILKSTMRTREYLEKGEVEGKSLLDAIRDGDTEGMQHFDGEIEKLIRADMIDYDTAMAYSTNPGNLRLQLADLLGEAPATAAANSRPAEKAKPIRESPKSEQVVPVSGTSATETRARSTRASGTRATALPALTV